MYCQHCGNELQRQNLSFCNRCGGQVNTELEKLSGADLKIASNTGVVRSLSVATGFVSVCGVIAVASIINQLIFRGDIQFAAFMLVTVFCVLIFGIIFLLVNQISRLSFAGDLNKSLQKRRLEPLFEKQNNQMLPDFQPVLNSVTERTTRNLENVPREKY